MWADFVRLGVIPKLPNDKDAMEENRCSTFTSSNTSTLRKELPNGNRIEKWSSRTITSQLPAPHRGSKRTEANKSGPLKLTQSPQYVFFFLL